MIAEVGEAKERIHDLLNLISDPLASSLYRTHPNDLGANCYPVEKSESIPTDWNCWWQWSAEHEGSWKNLVRASNAISSLNESKVNEAEVIDNYDFRDDGFPEEIRQLLFRSKILSLSRRPQHTPVLENSSSSISSKGMSPKKFHEVTRMTAYVLDVLDSLKQSGTEIRHVVDIGAGQVGHLSRSLRHARNLDVLALDSTIHPGMRNAARGHQRIETNGTLTYRTLWLGQGPVFDTHPGLQGAEIGDHTDFEQTIDEWITSLQGADDEVDIYDEQEEQAVPVLFVTLHACGSLTRTVLRKVLVHQRSSSAKERSWFVAAAVVVGCCYNLMVQEDFPLSRHAKAHIERNFPSFTLSANHLQLAAQVPSQWFRSLDAERATELSMKKILYRALIAPVLSGPLRDNSDGNSSPQKMGKLHGKACENFETYLSQAGQKMGMDYLSSYKKLTGKNASDVESTPLARRILALHAVRCLLGPPVESLIILDRYLWLREELDGDDVLHARLVNLFDQETGSGRNIGIVLKPV